MATDTDTHQTIVGTFESHDQAEMAVRTLIDAGVSAEHLAIVTQQLESQERIHGYVTAGDYAATGAGTGAWIGGIFGLLTGAAFLWVPGIGQVIVVGWLTGAVISALEGGAAGGIIGAVLGQWAHRHHVLKYEEELRGGKVLVVARGDAGELATVRRIMSEHQARDTTVHRSGEAASA